MLKIGLLGLGNVGLSVVDILSSHSHHLKERTGTDIQLKSILVRDTQKKREISLSDYHVTSNADDILLDPEIDIVIEVMGGEEPALSYIKTALENKKYVVTANKEVVSKHKETFFKLAKDNGVDIYYEAAVGGGIPLIRALKVGFAANKIQSFFGILNGTTNYILSKIAEDQADFDVVLKQAQDLGFAEADPTMDITGLDAAHKLVILSAVVFNANLQVDQVFYEGIESITLTDIQRAAELGYVIKLLAIGKRIDNSTISCRVHPLMIPDSHLLAAIKNESNALFVDGDYVGEALLSGKGAGGNPTGSAVISDVIDIAFDREHLSRRNLEDTFKPVDLLSMDKTMTQYYFRLQVLDEPGVFEKVSKVFADHSISLSKISQKESSEGLAEIVLVTHKIQEKSLALLRTDLDSLNVIQSISSMIRVGL